MDSLFFKAGCIFLLVFSPVVIVLAIIRSIRLSRMDRRWKKMFAAKGFVPCDEQSDYLNEISEFTLGKVARAWKASINGREIYRYIKVSRKPDHMGADSGVSSDIEEEIAYTTSRRDAGPVIVILGFDKAPEFAKKLLKRFMDFAVRGNLKRIQLPVELGDSPILAVYSENERNSIYDLVPHAMIELLLRANDYGVRAFSYNRGHAIISYDLELSKKGQDEFWCYLECLMGAE